MSDAPQDLAELEQSAKDSETVPLEPIPDPLSARHRVMLETESGIRPDVIAARGYETITVKARLTEIGFSNRQCRVPALLIPVYGISGEITTYQIRPDTPRIDRTGKVIKYETPLGSRMDIDVSPLIREQVIDVRVPLVITEGVKKADAAISHGACCLALLGVWNWKGKDDLGGRRALATFDRIPWNDRPVTIIFDSDLIEKESVAHALRRIGHMLQDSYKASVRITRLPNLPALPTSKKGVVAK